MTRTAVAPKRSLTLYLAAFLATLVALWTLGSAQAQDDAIEFEIRSFRVDLVRNNEGDIVERFTEVEEAIPGEEIEYRVTVRHGGDVIFRPGRLVVTVPIGEGLEYLEGSATEEDERFATEFSGDGGATFMVPPVTSEGEDGETVTVPPERYDHVRWTFLFQVEPDHEETLVYRVTVR